ncbi:cadherin-like domain-containing protein [Chitinophagales bacterium]|nr:cadherin-like domain-containing protein [Chitinophagales bacterium]
MKYGAILFSLLILIFGSHDLYGEKNKGVNGQANKEITMGKTDSGCSAATAQTELNINNVRTRLLTGGDMWWDLNAGKYEVPKVEPGSGEVSRNSLFAGALWIGGVDELGQLKIAAQTYRQSGNDFYPGPLDGVGEINSATCSQFDRFWEVKGADIDDLLVALELNNGSVTVSDVPESILQWPGRNNPYFSDFVLPIDKDLAPFWDNNGDGEYDPLNGDYPVIDSWNQKNYADQMIWWVFNDKGNSHTETEGEAIGLELSALAFAFATNDAINNMTFYKFDIDNYSTTALNDTYFGQWVDPDLGDFEDDFVGCDTLRNLGIVYNGDAEDGPSNSAYPGDPPMLGVDFFQGPLDETGVELGMSSFMYYNSDFTLTGNPETASHYYNFLRGRWKNNQPMTFGGNGVGAGEPFPYMFPSDPTDQSATAWSECGNVPADRRFLQSSGPFRLLPGATNTITIGVMWVKEGALCGAKSFAPLIDADLKAQALFDNDFEPFDGPDAPNIAIRELDQELILSLWNPRSSNNYKEEFSQTDPFLAAFGATDSSYNFQGYRIFQLKNSTVHPVDFGDPSLAREIFTVDLEKDGVKRVISYEDNNSLASIVPVLRVEGSDNGIRHTFRITEDQFASGDNSLVNNKRYYFSAVAYAHNAHEPYDPLAPSGTAQRFPYLEGRYNVNVYTAIPHLTPPEGGVVLNSSYGDGPEITRINGIGNGGSILELTQSSHNSIRDEGSLQEPIYEAGFGPIDLKIYDPLLVQAGNYELRLERNDYSSFPNTTAKGGFLELVGDGRLRYTPPADLASRDFDFFSYELTNESCITDEATVVIKINNPPDMGAAFDDTKVYYNFDYHLQCTPANGCPALEIDVLANDAGGAFPVLVSVSEPSYGSAIINNGKLEYKADFNFFGKDQFNYAISAEGVTSSATVTVHILNPAETNYFEAVDDVVHVDSDGGVLELLSNDEGDLLGTANMPSSSRWVLENLTTGRIYHSESDIKKANEQAIGGWERSQNLWSQIDDLNESEEAYFYSLYDPQGFTVSIKQIPTAKAASSFLEASIEFDNVQSRWLETVNDSDGLTEENWIRAGDYVEDINFRDHYDQSISGIANPKFYDVNSWYENMLGGGVAPYALVNNTPSTVPVGEPENLRPVITISPACSDCYGAGSPVKVQPNNLQTMNSVDLVFTDNPAHWTKAVVVEMVRIHELAFGAATKNNIRRSQSRDISGNETEDIGTSWFPGYAIDLETGERLNIMFGENSDLGSENGRDMIWNPTSRRSVAAGTMGLGTYRMGGEHWVYIMNSKYSEAKVEEYKQKLDLDASEESLAVKRSVYDEVMYVATTILAEGFEMKTMAEGLVPGNATMRIRVAKPFYEVDGKSPVYQFNMTDYAANSSEEERVSALDYLRVVPNPYYGFSSYENSKFDNTVKITNLPAKATIRIFSVDGTFVRELGIDYSSSINGTSLSSKSGTLENSLEWDLKNFKGIPIASGVYILNVEATDLGESRTVKWFGVMREADLDTF